MPDIIYDAAEVNRSYAVFTDPATYKPFDLTKDFMRIVGCIDPRDEEDGLYPHHPNVRAIPGDNSHQEHRYVQR